MVEIFGKPIVEESPFTCTEGPMLYELDKEDVKEAMLEWVVRHRDPRTGDSVRVKIPVQNLPGEMYMTVEFDIGGE